jgi:hypothetical protein
MDSILLFPPGPSVAGSQLQLGTYLMWDPGADYGAQALIQSIEATNALRDGGAFALRNVGPRKMSFPLLLRDVPGQTLLQTEGLLRRWSTNGAAVAVQTETTPSGQAMFFDVIDGRWEPDYDGFENRSGHRKGTLFLDTQPWGYWPTMMLIASSASVGGPGILPFTGSFIGDAPGLGELFIVPTTATSYGPNMKTEMLAWSFSARPSFQAFWPAGSLIGGLATFFNYPGTLIGDAFAPASQAIRTVPTQINTTFAGMVAAAIPATLEPAYRGRFRLFAFARFGPSQAAPWLVTADAAAGSYAFTAVGIPGGLASSNPIATLPVAVASNGSLGGQGASPAYSVLDLGEIGLPLVASQQNSLQIRLWGEPPVSSVVANTFFDVGGIYLLPVDGAAGILTRGLNQPSLNASSNTGFQGNFYQSALTGDAFITLPTSVVGSISPVKDARAFYRGGLPLVGASQIQLDLLQAGWRIQDGTPSAQPPLRSQPHFASVSVRYRPSFQFLYGL